MHRDSYGIKRSDDYGCALVSSEDSDSKLGQSGRMPNYSKDRDYSLGTRTGTGRVNKDADTNQGWSDSEKLETGLRLRQPI